MQQRSEQNPRQRALKGFTLSEVLITLVIIGVISAIAIPNVLVNSRKNEASARLKKFYSEMNKAVLMAKARGNDWEFWADSPNNDIESYAKLYLLPYLNYTKTEKINDSLYIYLTDGSYLYIHSGDCMDLKYDLNGLKKPNVAGRDIFTFLYCPYSMSQYLATGQVIPVLNKEMPRSTAIELCKTTNQLYCSGVLYYDGWEFKDDYPHRI